MGSGAGPSGSGRRSWSLCIPAAGIAGYAIGDSGTRRSRIRDQAHHSTGTSTTTGNGSKAKSKLSNATGSKYVTQQSNSPNSVSVP